MKYVYVAGEPYTTTEYRELVRDTRETLKAIKTGDIVKADGEIGMVVSVDEDEVRMKWGMNRYSNWSERSLTKISKLEKK